jgi:hypothetical protein
MTAAGADPIASLTLARLYLGQGHFGRAQEVLEECLRRDPQDGAALVLHARLAARRDAAVALTHTDGHVQATWSAVPLHPRAYLVVMAFAPGGPSLARWVSSRRCDSAMGQTRFALPFARGSVCACVGYVDDARGFEVVAVARPLSWPG